MIALNPKVSVVIPVRDGERWIGATLKSVFDQELSPSAFEIIVVDDGSTDNTAELCRTLLAGRPIDSTVYCQSASGVSAARNRGVALAQTDWIKLLDADDLLHPKILEEELGVALATLDDVAAVASPWCRFREDMTGVKTFVDIQRPSFTDWATLTLLRADGFVPVGSYLLRKSWWQSSNGFTASRAHVEDVDFLLRVSDAGGKFVTTAASAARFFYRTRSDSVSMSNQTKVLEGSILNAQAVEARAVQNGRMCVALKEVLLVVYSQGLRYWFDHDRSKFDALYRHVIALEPHYIPSGPPVLSNLSRVLGYPAAEHVARLYRCGKRVVQGMLGSRGRTAE